MQEGGGVIGGTLRIGDNNLSNGRGWNYDLSIFRFMHGFGQFLPPIWRTLHRKTTQIWWLADMNTNIWSCGRCVVAFVVDIWCFVPTSAHPLLFWDEWFVQLYLDVTCLLLGSFNLVYHVKGASFAYFVHSIAWASL